MIMSAWLWRRFCRGCLLCVGRVPLLRVSWRSSLLWTSRCCTWMTKRFMTRMLLVAKTILLPTSTSFLRDVRLDNLVAFKVNPKTFQFRWIKLIFPFQKFNDANSKQAPCPSCQSVCRMRRTRFRFLRWSCWACLLRDWVQLQFRSFFFLHCGRGVSRHCSSPAKQAWPVVCRQEGFFNRWALHLQVGPGAVARIVTSV